MFVYKITTSCGCKGKKTYKFHKCQDKLPNPEQKKIYKNKVLKWYPTNVKKINSSSLK